jgi:type IV pilus assembly protein PilW
MKRSLPPLIRPQSAHRIQRGFTLVEILVAMAIGLVMIAGILQVSAANRESSRLQRNMGFVQENIRSAMELLARDIRQAGYTTDLSDSHDPFIGVSAPSTDTSSAITADGGGANNDQITLTYESNQDCLGQDTPVVGGNRFAINHFFISNQRLMCQGNGGAAAEPLVEGVESMQILYGENTDGDPRSANRYVRPEQVGNIKDVVSVRLALRFISREPVRQTTDTNQYALLDASAIPASDRLLRREITTTISLRNER